MPWNKNCLFNFFLLLDYFNRDIWQASDVYLLVICLSCYQMDKKAEPNFLDLRPLLRSGLSLRLSSVFELSKYSWKLCRNQSKRGRRWNSFSCHSSTIRKNDFALWKKSPGLLPPFWKTRIEITGKFLTDPGVGRFFSGGVVSVSVGGKVRQTS